MPRDITRHNFIVRVHRPSGWVEKRTTFRGKLLKTVENIVTHTQIVEEALEAELAERRAKKMKQEEEEAAKRLEEAEAAELAEANDLARKAEEARKAAEGQVPIS
jgi:hypothetical protein